jgi:hypothetical protein
MMRIKIIFAYLMCYRSQYKYIVIRYKINLLWLRNRPEKLAKGSLFYLFLKLVEINLIFSDNVLILYIYVNKPDLVYRYSKSHNCRVKKDNLTSNDRTYLASSIILV